MNRVFKTLWSSIRQQYVVADEAHTNHGKPAKTLLNAVVAGALALSAGTALAAFDNPITNDNLPTIGEDGRHTTKLVAGNGQEVVIQTDGSVSELLKRVQEAGSMDKLEGIRHILGPSEDLSHVVMTGVTGGSNVMSQQVNEWLTSIDQQIVKDFVSSFQTAENLDAIEFEGDTTVTIGAVDKSSNPLVLGVVGGDLSILQSTSRTGTARIHISSGNTAGVIGGSALIGQGLINEEPLHTDITASEVLIDGFANVAGVVSGGVAVGFIGSKVASNVVDHTSLIIDIAPEAQAGERDGIVAGALGGGLAAATGFAQAEASAGTTTTIDVRNGTVGMLVGGGAAIAFDVKTGDEIIDGLVLGGGIGAGTATATSGNIGINLGAASTTVGVLGGGIALADAFGDHTADSTATAESVTIVLDGAGISEEQKLKVHQAFYNLEDVVSAPSLDGLTTFLKDVSVDGVHLGTLGGGAAIARGYFGSTDAGHALATSAVKTVSMTVKGGYNVGVIGGGVAVGWDKMPHSESPAKQIHAQSTVEHATVVIEGGENVLVMGGGLSYATGNHGNNSFVSADSTVKTADLVVRGGSVDGLVGGGMAWDDTGATQTNASVTGKTVNIVVENGTVNVLNTDPFRTFGGIGTELADALDASNAAIVGGGIALGEKASAVVDTVNIAVTGGIVTGNIIAGGLSGVAEYEANSAVVNHATVLLSDKAVFEGTWIDASDVAETAKLVLEGASFDLSEVTVSGFGELTATGEATIGTVDLANRESASFAGLFNIDTLRADSAAVLDVTAGAVALKHINADVAYNATSGVLAFGDQADASKAYDAAGGFNAIPALVLSGNVDLTGVTANIGTAAEDASGVTIGSDGALVADAAVRTSVTGTITAEGNNGLYFTGVAAEGAQVSFEQDGLNGFDVDSIVVDNIRYAAINDNNTFTFGKINDAGALRARGLDGFDSAALDLIEQQTDSASEYIKDLLDGSNTFIQSGEHRHAQLNAAFNLAAAGGVQTAGIESAMIGIDQAGKRASLINSFTDGWSSFAEVTGTQADMGGGHSALETRTQLGGLAVGGEYTSGNMTFGVLANVGTGDVEGRGNNDGADNDVDYYGIQAYAAQRFGSFNLVGQLGWMMTKHDVTHRLGDKADIDANVWTVGARGEWAYNFNDSVRMVPYVGVNWLRVSTDGYTTAKGFAAGDVDQDLFNVPVGVAFSGHLGEAGGWQMRPTADIAYVHTFGDTDVETSTRVGSAAMTTNLDVWSENVGRVRLGFEAAKDNMAFGLTLGGAAGSDDYREIYGQINAKYVF